MTKTQIEIRELVRWALVDQGVEEAVRAAQSAFGGGGGMASSTASLEAMLKLGCKVDGHGPSSDQIIVDCHPDAIDVYDAIWCLKGKARNLVYFHGFRGGAPDWLEEGVGALVPKLGKNGKPVRMFQDRREVGQPVQNGYLMTYDGYPPHEVKLARAEYGVWWEALMALQIELQNNLSVYNPLPPSLSRHPWMERVRKVG